jgi:hypothetical protein
VIVTGGELNLQMLDLNYNEEAKFLGGGVGVR